MRHSVLIIGLGNIGCGYDLNLDSKFVYSHARAFTQHQKFRLVGGVDPDKDKRDIFNKTYNCPAYIELKIALYKHAPDVVVIAVPTEHHNNVLKQVLSVCKPQVVLCEKPISYNLEEAEYIVAECARKDVNLYVNYMRRSDPGVIEIKKRINSGAMGNKFKGLVWYSKGLFNNGSHFVNLLEYWLGDVQSSSRLSQGRYWDKTDPEPDIQFEFENGSVVFLSAWEEAFSHYTMELLSKYGRLRYEQGGKLIEWQSVVEDSELNGYIILSDIVEKIPSEMNRYQLHVASQLAKAIAGKHSDLCTGMEALKTLKSMYKIFK
jgi:predicted dehydrogenase